MHVVIRWPDQWLAVAASEQAYRERVTTELLSPINKRSTTVLWKRADGTVLRQLWHLGAVICERCRVRYPCWVDVALLDVLRHGDVIGRVRPGVEGTATAEHVAWENPPPTPRCPLCHPVDSLRVDMLSPVDRVRLLQALAGHDDVAECLAVEADRAQARLGGETHERPRAPADVLRLAELEHSSGFARALKQTRSTWMEAFDIQSAVFLRVEPMRHHAEVTFAVPTIHQPDKRTP